MSIERRLDALERGRGDGRVTFEIVTPADGLTGEEHAEWSEVQRRNAETRGGISSTLNLGAADVR